MTQKYNNDNNIIKAYLRKRASNHKVLLFVPFTLSFFMYYFDCALTKVKTFVCYFKAYADQVKHAKENGTKVGGGIACQSHWKEEVHMEHMVF